MHLKLIDAVGLVSVNRVVVYKHLSAKIFFQTRSCLEAQYSKQINGIVLRLKRGWRDQKPRALIG